MAEIANNIKPSKATVSVGTKSYTAHVNMWRIKAEQPVDTPVDVSGKPRPVVGDPQNPQLVLNVSQDFSSTGFARALYDGRGTAMTVVVADANSTWTCPIIAVMPPSIGGDAGKAAREDITFPMTDLPARADTV